MMLARGLDNDVLLNRTEHIFTNWIESVLLSVANMLPSICGQI